MAKSNKEVQVRKDSVSARNPTVYNPWADMNRMMERFLNDPFGSWLSEMPTVNRRTLTDIKETDKGYVLCAEIPGIPKEDVDISVNGNMLTIRAEHREEEGKEDSELGYRRQYRSFHQSFSLPSTIDAEKIEANCENGMLEVFLPKTEAAQPKKIEVQSGKGGFLSRLGGKKEGGEKGQQEKH
jgi:HSP20 family protein